MVKFPSMRHAHLKIQPLECGAFPSTPQGQSRDAQWFLGKLLFEAEDRSMLKTVRVRRVEGPHAPAELRTYLHFTSPHVI